MVAQRDSILELKRSTLVPRWIRQRNQRRRLQAAIDRASAEYAPRVDAARDVFEHANASHTWDKAVEDDEIALGLLETEWLQGRARRWKVQISEDSWLTDESTSGRVISPIARVRLDKDLHLAMRETVRWWIQVVVMPLTGLMGVTIGLLSLLWKR